MKLNIGDKNIEHEGYTGVDILRGQNAGRLEQEDESCDEVRASHVLEHWPHGNVLDVLREWVRVLKPGGVLKIAVPDFALIVQQYLAGANDLSRCADIYIQGFVMGGQIDEYDFHKTIFDRGLLTKHLTAVGLEDIRDWQDAIEDTSRLPISLNLCGTKVSA